MSVTEETKPLFCTTVCNDCGEEMDECICDQISIDDLDDDRIDEWELRGATFQDYKHFVIGD